jgi:hypothetical protein
LKVATYYYVLHAVRFKSTSTKYENYSYLPNLFFNAIKCQMVCLMAEYGLLLRSYKVFESEARWRFTRPPELEFLMPILRGRTRSAKKMVHSGKPVFSCFGEQLALGNKELPDICSNGISPN